MTGSTLPNFSIAGYLNISNVIVWKRTLHAHPNNSLDLDIQIRGRRSFSERVVSCDLEVT